jgi:hypothetical protein
MYRVCIALCETEDTGTIVLPCTDVRSRVVLVLTYCAYVNHSMLENILTDAIRTLLSYVNVLYCRDVYFLRVCDGAANCNLILVVPTQKST